MIVVVFLGLSPVWVSLGSALSSPSLGTSLGSRLAEWAREHGASPVVNWAENVWYTHHAPPVGGIPVKGTIPAPAKTVASVAGSDSPKVASNLLPVPASITPFASPPIAGEGAWHPVGRLVDGSPAIYEAFLRPD
ncbi:MAG: hypothetical protein L3J91_02460, partial [Thermoplasmata archaeon]|nr:hypothetical protein [Thermoplasmata archaeon]